MKNKTVGETTTNRSIYKKTVFGNLKCPFCPPNKGCNAHGKFESDSWKDQSKRRKQWKNK